VLLSRWLGWRSLLTVVQPETLTRWHRQGWRLFWRWKSRAGRPPIPSDLQQLLVTMARANPTWGEERIADELLLKLGLIIAPLTVGRYLRRLRPSHGDRRSQRWATFVCTGCTMNISWSARPHDAETVAGIIFADHRRIRSLLLMLSPAIPVLATTATANARVAADVADQLDDTLVLRGPLDRESLRLGVLSLSSSAHRLAWLADHLGELPGSGIIYTLTVGSTEQAASFLRTRGHSVTAYSSKPTKHGCGTSTARSSVCWES
jgi:hypothetical protein